MVAGLLPWWVQSSPIRLPLAFGPWRWLGLLPLGAGLALLLATILDFAVVGRGTLAPWDAPRQLVTSRRYRWVRNPMYLGVLSLILGQGLLLQSGGVLALAGVLAGVFHLRVVYWEEPVLRRQFGPEFEAYRAAVPRWIPRSPPRMR